MVTLVWSGLSPLCMFGCSVAVYVSVICKVCTLFQKLTNYLSLYSASASQSNADRVFMVTGSKPRRSTSHITWSQSIRSTTQVYSVRAAPSASSSAKVLMRAWLMFTKFDTSNCSATTCNVALASSLFRRCVDAGASMAVEGALAA